MNSISVAGIGARLGTVTFTDTPGGLLITPKLSGLPPGQHGFTFMRRATVVSE